MYSLIISLITISLVIIIVIGTLKMGSQAFGPALDPEQRTRRLKELKTAMDIVKAKL